MSKKSEQAVVRAAMRESMSDIVNETGTMHATPWERMRMLAQFCSPQRAARLRACAAHAKSKKGKR